MTAFAKDHARRWEPFGVTEADFATAPERDGVRVVNVTPGGGTGSRAGLVAATPRPRCGAAGRRGGGGELAGAVHDGGAVKQATGVAALEAGIPDVARSSSPRWAWRWRCTAGGRSGRGR